MPSAGSRKRRRSFPGRHAPQLGSFVCGAENQLALSAVRHLAEDPAYLPSPVLLQGPPGCGKSHLLGGLARELRVQHPGLRQRHFTADRLTRAHQAASHRREPQAFSGELGALDLLLLDDLDRLSSRKATQRLLSRAIETIREHGGQAVLACRNPPRAIAGLSADLASRLHQGVLLRVDPAGHQTRLALLRSALSAREVQLGPALQELIAARVAGPAGLAIVVELLDHLRRKGQPLNRALIEELLERGTGGPRAGSLTAICALVEQDRGLEPGSLVEPGGPRTRAAARRLALLLADGVPRAELAAHFGIKPGSASAALRTARRELAEDPALAREVEALRARLAGG